MKKKSNITAVFFLTVIVFLYSYCAQDSKSSDSSDTTAYETVNLPDAFHIEIPESISPDEEADTRTIDSCKKTRQAFSDYDTGLQQIKKAVASSKKILFDEGVELEYIFADAFYSDAKKYISESGEEFIPENTISITYTAAIHNRLLESLMQYLTESEAKTYLAEEIGYSVGDEVENPNIRISASENILFDEVLSYWWDDEPEFITYISWSKDKKRIQVRYSEEYTDSSSSQKNYTWTFSYYYDITNEIMTLRDVFSGFDEDTSSKADYNETLTLQKCDSATDAFSETCVKVKYTESYTETINETGCEIENGKLTVFGTADDDGGFIEKEGSYKCDSGLPEKEFYREEFNGNGEITNTWYSENGVLWFDADNNAVTQFSSKYFNDDFKMDQVEVKITGTFFDYLTEPETDQFYDLDFVLAPKTASTDDPQFEDHIVAGGYFYYENNTQNGESKEFEVQYWGDQNLITETGLTVYKEEYIGNRYVYTIIPDAVVSLN